MSARRHRCTSCREPVYVAGSMCQRCRGVNGGAAREVVALPALPAEPPCATYLREHDVRAEGDPWFPEGHDRVVNAELRAIATLICDGCPVFDACATARRKRDVGIWAGAEWERPGNETRAVRRAAA